MGPVSPIQGQGKDGSYKSSTRTREGWVLLVLYKDKGRMGPVSPIQRQGKDGSCLVQHVEYAEIFYRLRDTKREIMCL